MAELLPPVRSVYTSSTKKLLFRAGNKTVLGGLNKWEMTMKLNALFDNGQMSLTDGRRPTLIRVTSTSNTSFCRECRRRKKRCGMQFTSQELHIV